MAKNFGGEEVLYSYDESQVIIVHVPYDATSTYIKGADQGPDAILDASAALEFYDIETRGEAHKVGIHTIDPVITGDDPVEVTGAVNTILSNIFSEGRFP